MLLEDFKSCLPSEIKTHLDEQKADLHQSAVWEDDYTLTHKVSSKKIQSLPVENVNKVPGELKQTSSNHTASARGKMEPS